MIDANVTIAVDFHLETHTCNVKILSDSTFRITTQ